MNRNECMKVFVAGLGTSLLMLYLIVGTLIATGCSSSIHNQARIITYLGLTVADADEDDTLKVKAIAGAGLTLIANGEEAENVSYMIRNLVQTQFRGRHAGLIEIMWDEVSAMVLDNLDLDIPDEYRLALIEAMNGIIAGTELYLRDLEGDD